MRLITDELEIRGSYLIKTNRRIEIGKRYFNDTKRTPYYMDRFGNKYHLFYQRDYLNRYAHDKSRKWVYSIEKDGAGLSYIYIALSFWSMIRFKLTQFF
jgi:hypothetical protein